MTENDAAGPRRNSDERARLIGIALGPLSAGGDGGAGQSQTQDHDRVRGEGVQDAVHSDRHDVVPFEIRGPGRPAALSDVDGA